MAADPKANGSARPTIFLGCDHGGVELKNHLKGHLEKRGYPVTDYGTHSPDPVDYPDIAFLVARAVSESRAGGNAAFGIMIDGVGVASSMVCNRVAGVRSAPCWNEFSARSARQHNNANVMTLGGQLMGPALARTIVDVFLQSDYEGGRHQRRVDKIHTVAGEPPPGRGGTA